MKALLCSYLLSALASTSFAAVLQYKTRTDIATGFYLLSGMAVADFNGDGKPDIVATDIRAKNLYVYLNDGTGNFGAPKITPVTMMASGAGKVITGDFNEDGKQDVILATVSGYQASIILTGNNDGTFTQQQDVAGGYGFVSGVAVDINKDKHLDLVLGLNGSTYSFIGDGHGGFQKGNLNSLGGGYGDFTGVTVADFNLDSNPDVVVVSINPPSDIRFYSGAANGNFSSPVIVPQSSFPQPAWLSSADFNGDGFPDLLVGATDLLVGATDSAGVVPGNGDGTFDFSKLSYLAIPQGKAFDADPPMVAAVDIDGDKKVDAVVSDDVSHTINIFLNDGTGEFSQSSPDFSAPIGSGGTNLSVADLNDDGIPDLIVNSGTQNISIFLSIKPKLVPTVGLSSSSPSQFVGSSVNIMANVSGGDGTPTGAVTLMDGSVSLGQQTLDSSGNAVFSLSNLSAGQHNLTAAYAGDTNFNAVTSTTLSQSITDLQLSFTTASQTVSSGGTATYILAATPVGGLSGSVTLTCSGLPSQTTCDPATITLTGQPATTSLSVRTSAPVNSKRSRSYSAYVFLPLLALCCTRRRRVLTPLLSVSALFILSSFAMGCGSNNSSSSSTTVPGTPIGSTTFTVTGTVTNGGSTLTRTATAALIVQ